MLLGNTDCGEGAPRMGREGGPIHLVGVEFSKDARNVVAFEVESESAEVTVTSCQGR